MAHRPAQTSASNRQGQSPSNEVRKGIREIGSGRQGARGASIEGRIAVRFSVDVGRLRRVMRAFSLEAFGAEALELDRADTCATVDRRLCAQCGTQAFSEAEERPTAIFIRACTLEDLVGDVTGDYRPAPVALLTVQAPFLAIEMRHRLGRVALAFGGVFGYRLLDRGKISGAKADRVSGA